MHRRNEKNSNTLSPDKQKTNTSKDNPKQVATSTCAGLSGTNKPSSANTSIANDVEKNKTSKLVKADKSSKTQDIASNTPKQLSSTTSDITLHVQGGSAVVVRQKQSTSSDSILNDDNLSKVEIKGRGG